MESETPTQTPEGEGEKKPAADAGKGVQPQTTSLIDGANAAAERLKKENDRRENLLAEEKELEARKALGGGSEAGKPSDEKKETPREYAERKLRGE